MSEPSRRAGVDDVGVGRVERGAVLGGQRHLPEPLARRVGGGLDRRSPFARLGEVGADQLAEGDRLCPGEGRDVDEMRGALALGPMERIGRG